MAETVYKLVNGEKVPLKASEIKSFVMNVMGYKTTEEYNKAYDIMRNKVRAFEKVTGQKEKSSISTLMYLQAKSMQRYGSNYTPSDKMQMIMSMPSVSSGKALQGKSLERALKAYGRYTDRIFGGLVAKDDMAKYISDMISDPLMRNAALTDYANLINANKKALRDGKTFQSNFNVAYIQAAEEFDINAYLV